MYDRPSDSGNILERKLKEEWEKRVKLSGKDLGDALELGQIPERAIEIVFHFETLFILDDKVIGKVSWDSMGIYGQLAPGVREAGSNFVPAKNVRFQPSTKLTQSQLDALGNYRDTRRVK